MGLDLAQALLGSAFAGETLSGMGSGNVTEEVWAGWIKNQTPQKPDDVRSPECGSQASPNNCQRHAASLCMPCRRVLGRQGVEF